MVQHYLLLVCHGLLWYRVKSPKVARINANSKWILKIPFKIFDTISLRALPFGLNQKDFWVDLNHNQKLIRFWNSWGHFTRELLAHRNFLIIIIRIFFLFMSLTPSMLSCVNWIYGIGTFLVSGPDCLWWNRHSYCCYLVGPHSRHFLWFSFPGFWKTFWMRQPLFLSNETTLLFWIGCYRTEWEFASLLCVNLQKKIYRNYVY
jgi:hypothetical protein